MSLLFDHLAKLNAYLGATDLLNSLLASPLFVIFTIALIARYFASSTIKEVEGVDKLCSEAVDKLKVF